MEDEMDLHLKKNKFTILRKNEFWSKEIKSVASMKLLRTQVTLKSHTIYYSISTENKILQYALKMERLNVLLTQDFYI